MTVYSVSSLFIDTSQEQAVTPVRNFYIGNSDYSSFVTGWPKVTRRWNEIKPNKVTVKVANQNKTFNFFKSDPVKLRASSRVEIGVQFTTSSSEVYTIFEGTVGKVNFTGDGTTANISLIDKVKPFSERVVGSSDDPLDYTTSNYYPADIAWYLVTSYGGLSTVTSTSNPDIDYQSWSDWRAVFSDNSVVCNARFDGQKLNECLRKIGRITGSSIFEENGKLNFSRFSTSSSGAAPVNSNAFFNISLNIDDARIINKQIVNADYDTTSKYFKITVNDESTYSVNSYGLREQLEKDSKLWYVNSVAALDYAQRAVDINKDPPEKYRIKTGVQLLARAVGETIQITHDPLDLSEDVFRIMGYTFDVDRCSGSYDLDKTQLRTFFTLDDAVLGLLDQATNPLG